MKTNIVMVFKVTATVSEGFQRTKEYSESKEIKRNVKKTVGYLLKGKERNNFTCVF